VRIARIQHGGRPVRAIVDGDRLALLDAAAGTSVPLADARLLAPTDPRVVLGMAHNTGAADRLLPPQAFLKPSRTVIGPGAPIPLPDGIGHVDAEGELAVVIGTTARHLTATTALEAVLGYTVANDVTARDLQRSDPLWTTAKGHDGFTPLGPWIETDLDAADAEIVVSRNGRALRGASPRDLARDVVEVLVYVTSFLTLGPGDVVLTGAPGECARIRPGDRVEIAVAGVGTLTNPVVAAPARGRVPQAHDRDLRAQPTAGRVVGAARVRPVRGPASAVPDGRLDHEAHRSGLAGHDLETR
jgi:2-keto-4-pentenoate hydratase/2-oxohepta-3-ene-1,7-dioic acid hydratase in catechol pathway